MVRKKIMILSFLIFLSGCVEGINNDVSSSSGVVNPYDNSWKSLVMPEYGYRDGFSAVSFKDKIFVIGGSIDSSSANGARNDIWSSTNGSGWVRETLHAAFSPRMNFSLSVFQDKLWLIGGSEEAWLGGHTYNDVWSSTNGIDWVCVNSNASFSPKRNHSTYVLGNKLYVIGGYNSSDLWCSEDGSNWIQETTEVEFNYGMGICFVYQNEAYFGINYNTSLWKSINGVNWNRILVANFNFVGTIYILNDKLYLVYPGHYYESTNGITWTLLSSNPGPIGNVDGGTTDIKESVVFNGKPYVFASNGFMYTLK